MPSKPSKFVWYDVMTTDVPAATKFYADVVGWKIQDSGQPSMNYSLLLAPDGTQVGGLMPIPEDAKAMGAKPHWHGYITVSDVDACADRIKSKGGTIKREPADIPGVGRFAVAADPGGAIFFVFRGNGEEPKDAAPNTPGHIGWRELHAADGKAAWDFYSDLFGWTKTDAMDMGELGTYQLFATGGKDSAGGMMTKMPDQSEARWRFYFNVPAIDAAAARVRKAGGTVNQEPMEVPGGQWIITGTDPQGAEFALLAPAR